MGKQVGTLKMTGSFGGAVGYIDRQGNVQMRSKAEKVNDANTLKQRVVRTRFLATSVLAMAFKGEQGKALMGLSPKAKQNKITLRNQFLKENFKNTTEYASGNHIEVQTEFDELKLSHGVIDNINTPTISTDTPLHMGFAWSLIGDEGDVEDTIYIVAYSETFNKIKVITAKRESGNAEIVFPAEWNGETVHLYAYAQHIADSNDRAYYESLLNDPLLKGGQAESDLRAIAGNAEYSETKYLGTKEIA